jgi:glycine oxidase
MSSVASSRKAPLRVAVVGAGVVGLSVALELRSRGADVVVHDRGIELGAGVTLRAAGMLGAAFEWAAEGEQRALAALARHAGMLWPDFAGRLERLGGGPVEFSQEGAIVVARTPAEMDWLTALTTACQARGMPALTLPSRDLAVREPALSGEVLSALLLPDDQQVDPVLVLQRLGAALTRMGVALRFGRQVERIAAGQHFLMSDGERFDRIVLANGAQAAPLFAGPRGAPLSPDLPSPVPVKGHMLALAPLSQGPRHVIHARDVYIAPKSRWILVGATSERGRADTDVDRAAIDQLRARAAALVPALADAPELTAWAGVRPGSPDDQPLIGETAIPGVFAALGHYRNGLLFAPATAEIVADQVIDGKVSPLAAAFDPRRFDKADAAPHSPSGTGSDT